jgi:hypothetical protein
MLQGDHFLKPWVRVIRSDHLSFRQVVYLRYVYVFDSIGRGGAI